MINWKEQRNITIKLIFSLYLMLVFSVYFFFYIQQIYLWRKCYKVCISAIANVDTALRLNTCDSQHVTQIQLKDCLSNFISGKVAQDKVRYSIVARGKGAKFRDETRNALANLSQAVRHGELPIDYPQRGKLHDRVLLLFSDQNHLLILARPSLTPSYPKNIKYFGTHLHFFLFLSFAKNRLSFSSTNLISSLELERNLSNVGREIKGKD